MTLIFSKTTSKFCISFRSIIHDFLWVKHESLELNSLGNLCEVILYNNLNCTGIGILKILISSLLLLDLSSNKSSSDEIKIKIKLNHIKSIALGFSQATICLVRQF